MRALLVVALISSACIPTTGGQLVSFSLQASGPADINAGQPYRFQTPAGYAVTLSEARLFVGAVYFNQSNPAGYSQETACVLPGIYTGQVLAPLEVNALDSSAQAFGIQGTGSDTPTLGAELWLTSGDVNADADSTIIVKTAGIAEKDGKQWPFEARYSIGQNRRLPPRNPALPGSNPLCKQRIVSPIPADLTLSEGAVVRLTVDPKAWFQAVKFSELKESQLRNGAYRFIDSSSAAGQPDIALYNAVRTAEGVYQFQADVQ
jgi:hypothetical protein